MSKETVLTPEFRVSYPNILTSRDVEKDQKDGTKKIEKEYGLNGIFPPGADLSAMKKMAQACLVEKLGADKTKWPANLRSPFRKCEERMKDGKLPDGYVAGGTFINVKSKTKPGLVNAQVQTIIDETEFYAGCYARAQVHAYYYEFKGNRGVAFGLDNVQKLRDGDSLSGRVRAEDAFEAVAGAESGAGAAEDIFAT